MKTRAQARGLSVNDQHTSTHELRRWHFSLPPDRRGFRASGTGWPPVAGDWLQWHSRPRPGSPAAHFCIHVKLNSGSRTRSFSFKKKLWNRKLEVRLSRVLYWAVEAKLKLFFGEITTEKNNNNKNQQWQQREPSPASNLRKHTWDPYLTVRQGQRSKITREKNSSRRKFVTKYL